MRRGLLQLAAVLAAAQISFGAATAGCLIASANPQVVAGLIGQSASVFYGTVVEIADDRSMITFRARFRVDRVYKGAVEPDAWLSVVRVSQLTCTYWNAKVGDRDIFFVFHGRGDMIAYRQHLLNGDEQMVLDALELLTLTRGPLR